MSIVNPSPSSVTHRVVRPSVRTPGPGPSLLTCSPLPGSALVKEETTEAESPAARRPSSRTQVPTSHTTNSHGELDFFPILSDPYKLKFELAAFSIKIQTDSKTKPRESEPCLLSLRTRSENIHNKAYKSKYLPNNNFVTF